MIPTSPRKAVILFMAALGWAAMALPVSGQEGQTLSLADAVARALQYSPELAVARADIRAASARTMQAAAFAAPELALSWEAMPAFFKPADADERSLGISQSFEFPRKRRYRLQALRREEDLAESRLQNERALLTARVKRAYFQALLAGRRIENLEKAVAWLQQFASMAASRYTAQSGTYLEVLRARVEKGKLESELILRRGEAEQCRAALNRLLGNPASLPLLLSDSFGEPPYTRSLAQETADRLRLNSRLLQGRSMLSREHSYLDLARSAFWPDLSLAVSRQWLNGQPPYDAGNFTGRSTNGWAIEIGIRLPFLWGKGTRAEALLARAGLEKAETIFAALEKDVRLATEVAFRRVKTAEAQVDVFHGSWPRAR